MAPYYGSGSTAKATETLQGGSLLFTTKFPEIPGTHRSWHDAQVIAHTCAIICINQEKGSLDRQ